MPRRPSKKNATVRKSSQGVNRAGARIKKWNKADDIPLDDEDTFHASRDKILLGGDNDQYDDGDEEEIFELKGMPEGDSDADMEGGKYHDEDEDVGEDVDTEEKPKKASKKPKKSKKKVESSDEEKSDEESEEESWGRGKAAYYSSNAAQLESEDEEGHELEEQEAMKIQRKLREDMTDADFGLEDQIRIETRDKARAEEASAPVPLPTDRHALLKHLERNDPESLSLARDWTYTTTTLIEIEGKLKNVESKERSPVHTAMLHLYHQCLLAYTAILAFYLHLRSQEKYAQNPALLKSHPIIQRLLSLKQSIITFDELDLDGDHDDDDDDDDDDEYDDDILDMDIEELRELLKESETTPGKKTLEKSPRKLLITGKRDVVDKDEESEQRPKKKRKTAKPAAAPVFDLEEPTFISSTPSKKKASSDDAFGEATMLPHVDALDKKARKKSLQFHTSRIESASARRQGARQSALGGDDDIPYRERQREKDARAAREAQARVSRQGGVDLDDVEPEPVKKGKRKADETEDELEGYYDLVKTSAKKEKEKKKKEYEEERATERYIEVEGDTSGPRSLTRAIINNRGLTPHRPKSVRNPRVKVRNKFDKRKQKVASQKAVYKGGLNQTGGRYEGEKSGISKVVKSVKLT